MSVCTLTSETTASLLPEMDNAEDDIIAA